MVFLLCLVGVQTDFSRDLNVIHVELIHVLNQLVHLGHEFIHRMIATYEMLHK